jgi:hypothetical protein
MSVFSNINDWAAATGARRKEVSVKAIRERDEFVMVGIAARAAPHVFSCERP